MPLVRVRLLAFIALHCTAMAAPAATWQTTRDQAAQAFEKSNCTKVWQLVWPWARGGNVQALAMLATGAYSANLLPPGISTDPLARLRHTLILSAHAAAGNDTANTQLLEGLLQEPLIADAGGRQLRECLAGNTAKEKCISHAVNDGFLPALVTYSKELALAEQQPHAKATCKLPGSATPLPTQ